MLKFHALRVSDVRPDADDAVAISLDAPKDVREEYRGLPGQHVVLRVEIGGAEVRRTYSLINAPGEWPLRIVSRVHENGVMSKYLAEHLSVGDTIDVLPPNGSMTPRLNATPGANTTPRANAVQAANAAQAVGIAPPFASGHLFVAFASGCGITPILSIALAALATNPANRFVLFYGNTSTARAMCLEELLALKDRYIDRLALHFVMSREPQEVDLYNGRIDASRVREFAAHLFAPASVAEYFVCGPGDMIDEVSRALGELGVQAERVHSEHFVQTTAAAGWTAAAGGSAASGASAAASEAASVGTPRRVGSAVPVGASAAQSPAISADQAEVTVVMDGRRRSFTMRMNDESILDAAERAGLELPFSCRAGVCSTCRTKVVRGEVEMKQNYALEEWELAEGYVLACQSRVKTPVLELDYDEK